MRIHIEIKTLYYKYHDAGTRATRLHNESWAPSFVPISSGPRILPGAISHLPNIAYKIYNLEVRTCILVPIAVFTNWVYVYDRAREFAIKKKSMFLLFYFTKVYLL